MIQRIKGQGDKHSPQIYKQGIALQRGAAILKLLASIILPVVPTRSPRSCLFLLINLLINLWYRIEHTSSFLIQLLGGNTITQP